MAENNEIVPPQFDENAKWDACLDLSVRRLVYSSVAGAFTGLLLFRSPVTRWASIAFGAGCGIGSAYTDCSHIFNGTSTKSSIPKITEATVRQTFSEALRREALSDLKKPSTICNKPHSTRGPFRAVCVFFAETIVQT